MTTKSSPSLAYAIALALPLALGGCGGAEKDANPPADGPPPAAKGPMAGGPGGGH